MIKGIDNTDIKRGEMGMQRLWLARQVSGLCCEMPQLGQGLQCWLRNVPGIF